MTEGAAAPGANGKYLDAFAVGEFRALFAAYTVSMLGDIVAAVALTVRDTGCGIVMRHA